MKSSVLIIWPSSGTNSSINNNNNNSNYNYHSDHINHNYHIDKTAMSTERRRRRFNSRRRNDSTHASTSLSLPETDAHVQQQQQSEPEMKSGIHHVTVVVMGASGVGKTAMLRQFVFNEFNEAYKGTSLKDYHYVTLVVNERIYEVKLVDCSQVASFPSTSLQEWSDYRGFCLRNASAYILVYDVTDDESFRYVRAMFEQIQKARNLHDVPILVVANKLDLLITISQQQQQQQQLQLQQNTGSAGGHHHHHHRRHHHHLHHHRRRNHSGSSSSIGSQGASAGQNGLTSCCHGSGSHGNGEASSIISDKHHFRLNRQEQANLVKKQMKCSFMECSAMLNWKVTAVFRELMKSLDQARFGHSSRVQDAFRNQRCLIS